MLCVYCSSWLHVTALPRPKLIGIVVTKPRMFAVAYLRAKADDRPTDDLVQSMRPKFMYEHQSFTVWLLCDS